MNNLQNLDSLYFVKVIDSLKIKLDSIVYSSNQSEQQLDTLKRLYENLEDSIINNNIVGPIISALIATILAYLFSKKIETWKIKEKEKENVYKVQEYFRSTNVLLAEKLNTKIVVQLKDLTEFSNNFVFLDSKILNKEKEKFFYDMIYKIIYDIDKEVIKPVANVEHIKLSMSIFNLCDQLLTAYALYYQKSFLMNKFIYPSIFYFLSSDTFIMYRNLVVFLEEIERIYSSSDSFDEKKDNIKRLRKKYITGK